MINARRRGPGKPFGTSLDPDYFRTRPRWAALTTADMNVCVIDPDGHEDLARMARLVLAFLPAIGRRGPVGLIGSSIARKGDVSPKGPV